VLHTLEEVPHGYRIGFSEDQGEPPYITFDVTYLDSARGWGILATVEVKSLMPTARSFDVGGTLLLERMNLMKGQERERMARRIDGLIPPPKSATHMDWEHHLEYIAVLVSRELGRPITTHDLHHMPNPSRPKFLIEGLLARDKTNILYGPGGTGKSLLALRIGGSVTTGESCFGFNVLDTGNVLYLDWEDDADEMIDRLERVSHGMGKVARFPVAYKGLAGRGPYERHHADIRLFVKTRDVKLVIVDSTAMAMHGSISGDGADGAIKFFQLIDQLETTVMLIDHVASDDVKSGDGAAKPYGSVFKLNSARNVWEVKPWKRNDLTGVTLKHRKTNVGRRYADHELQVTWAEHSVSFEHMSESEADYLASLDDI
jgi:hypothetical protein